jgi:hypothetical protein
MHNHFSSHCLPYRQATSPSLSFHHHPQSGCIQPSLALHSPAFCHFRTALYRDDRSSTSASFDASLSSRLNPANPIAKSNATRIKGLGFHTATSTNRYLDHVPLHRLAGYTGMNDAWFCAHGGLRQVSPSHPPLQPV